MKDSERVHRMTTTLSSRKPIHGAIGLLSEKTLLTKIGYIPVCYWVRDTGYRYYDYSW